MGSQEAATAQGKNIRWLAGVKSDHINDNILLCIFGTLNYSADGQKISKLDGDNMAPKIYQISSVESSLVTYLHALNSLTSWTFFPASKVYDFKFITAEGVQKLNAGFTEYLSPLQLWVWTYLAITVVATSTVVAIVNYYFGISGLIHAATDTFLWLLATLAENPFREYPTVLNKDVTNKRSFWRFYKAIFGVWVLAALILTNGYKPSPE
ncbi:unnamed protein product [Allacma fusca]|uniref:Uncharacterized protein n=1 Tax=Allacma fusca TaxID=39272 RepID=A0A8J2JYI5_9HEXA|nr:unnamed protein product [Allacma fusca]